MAETLNSLAIRREQLRAELAEVTDRLRVKALEAIADGRTEVEAARVAGVDRMTMRKWQGKAPKNVGRPVDNSTPTL